MIRAWYGTTRDATPGLVGPYLTPDEAGRAAQDRFGVERPRILSDLVDRWTVFRAYPIRGPQSNAKTRRVQTRERTTDDD